MVGIFIDHIHAIGTYNICLDGGKWSFEEEYSIRLTWDYTGTNLQYFWLGQLEI